MKQFIKENPTLAFGLGLPLLLVFALWAATEWVQRNTEPPKYDVIFATGYYDYNPGIRISVEGGKARLEHEGAGSNYANFPRLYRYHAGSGKVQEIKYTVPPEVKALSSTTNSTSHGGPIIAISVPELEALKLDPTAESRDGYTFEASRSSGPVAGELFFGSGSRSMITLNKGTYRKRIPLKETYMYNEHFIGWVIP